MRFSDKLADIQAKNNSLLCVGLDTDIHRLPKKVRTSPDGALRFNVEIIGATSEYVCAYKPNIAFYEAMGTPGMMVLKKTIEAIPREIPVILDAKRGDIGNTCRMYAKTYYEDLKVDAVTLSPYMGEDSIKPFLQYGNKCAFVLCLTSNPSSADIQERVLADSHTLSGLREYLSRLRAMLEKSKNGPGSLSDLDLPEPRIDHEPGSKNVDFVFELVAQKFGTMKDRSEVGLVVGATKPDQIRRIRELAPEAIMLIPGIGTQEGEIEPVVRHGGRTDGGGLIINVSRAVLYASEEKDYAAKAAQAADAFRREINSCRSSANSAPESLSGRVEPRDQ